MFDPRDSSAGVIPRHRGVSPVVGSVLLIAIVLLLAVVIGGLAAGFGSELHDPALQYDFESEYVADGEGNGDRPYVNLTYVSGETLDGHRLHVVDDEGNRVAWTELTAGGPDVTPGESVLIDGSGTTDALTTPCEGSEYDLVLQRGDDSSQVLTTITIDRPAVWPGSLYC